MRHVRSLQVFTGILMMVLFTWLQPMAIDCPKNVLLILSDVAAIIPTNTLQEVLRTLNDDINEVEVLFDESQVRFRLNDAEITSRLIDGNFPDYRQLIPTSSETTVTIPRAEFSTDNKSFWAIRPRIGW